MRENKNRKNLIIIIQIGKISRLSLILLAEIDLLKLVWANRRKFSGLEEGRLIEKFPFESDLMSRRGKEEASTGRTIKDDR